jgi:hypothetical protein
MKTWIFLACTALASSAALAKAPSPPTPLFASDAPIHVTIQGPFSTLVSNRAEIPRPATMTVDGVTYPITLSPRGITRKTRDTCDFPPLRDELTAPAPKGSLFEHQRKLKLVTHCRRDAAFQQKVLLEYSAYRLFNLMTPLSFRARLANVDYVNSDGQPYISRVGFFLEDFDDVGKRNAMQVAHMGSLVPLQQIEPASGARFAVFEYMISNYDWSMRAAPQGEECCHNGKMLTDGVPGSLLTIIPYDFDYSGLVDAPYALPPEGVPVDNVRNRSYRGYCAHMAQARAFAAQLSPRRAEFLGVFTTIPGMDPRTQARAAAFVQGFFTDIDSGKIFKNCLN